MEFLGILGRICRKYIGTILKMSGKLPETAWARLRGNYHCDQGAPSLTLMTTASWGTQTVEGWTQSVGLTDSETLLVLGFLLA